MPPSAVRRDALHLDRFLPYRLSLLTNTVSAALADTYAERFRLSIPEWRIVAVLAHSPGLSAAEVAARTAMDKVAVSRAVARLAAAGRVRRRRAPGDRRRFFLDLTPAGRRVYRRIVPWALAYERRLLAVLTAGEVAALDAVLSALIRQAQVLRRTAPRQRALPPGAGV